MANKNNTSFPSCTVTITLTPEARNFLAGTTAGVSHFAIYNDLLDNMAIVDTSFSKRGNIVPLFDWSGRVLRTLYERALEAGS